jgi:hypothetical protein
VSGTTQPTQSAPDDVDERFTHSMPPWASEVLAHASFLRSQASLAVTPEGYDNVVALLSRAETLVWTRPRWVLPRRILEWWSGGRIELAWSFLHDADLLLVSLARPDYIRNQALEYARFASATLDPADPVRRRLIDMSDQLDTPGSSAETPTPTPNEPTAG